MIDINLITVIICSFVWVILSALSIFKYYMPQPKRFKDLFTGKCGISLFVMITFFANLGGNILQLCGYSVGGF
jgi:hypothetical protein